MKRQSLYINREILILFIIFNFGMWVVMAFMSYVNYLQKTYVDAASQGFIFIVPIILASIGSGMLAKMFAQVDITKLANFSILLAYVHVFLDIIHFPNMNWLHKIK